MSFEHLLSLFMLSFVAAWTPGPNNALVASSGARFGVRRTLPHVAGIGIGFPVMVFTIALGLGELFKYSSLLRESLRWIGIAVLIWLSWKIAFSGGGAKTENRLRPFTFWESAAFQWINPKGWVMAISITSQYAGGSRPYASAIVIAAVFVFLGFTSAFGWTVFGRQMQRWLQTPLRLRVFNVSMAALILLSVFAILKAEL